MHRNVLVVTSPPTESNATSTPRPSVASSTASTKSLVAVVDRNVGTERPAQLDLLGRPGCRDDPRAGQRGQLDGGRADPAGGGMNQHGLAGPDVRPVVQGQPRQVEREVDGGCGRVGQLGLRGHLEGHRARADGQLRVATERTAGHRHHPSSEPLLGADPGPLHRAQHLHAGGVGQGRADGPVAAPHAVDVVEVEGRGRDPDQQLVRARHGRRNLLEPQDLLRLAELVHAPCPHVARLLHRLAFPGAAPARQCADRPTAVQACVVPFRRGRSSCPWASTTARSVRPSPGGLVANPAGALRALTCARRAAVTPTSVVIASGRVLVDGRVVTNPAALVRSDAAPAVLPTHGFGASASSPQPSIGSRSRSRAASRWTWGRARRLYDCPSRRGAPAGSTPWTRESVSSSGGCALIRGS